MRGSAEDPGESRTILGGSEELGEGGGGQGVSQEGWVRGHLARWDQCWVYGRLCRTDSPGPGRR